MLEIAGVQVPLCLRPQLEPERRAVEERAHWSPVASKLEAGPRLAHKLLRVLITPFPLVVLAFASCSLNFHGQCVNWVTWVGCLKVIARKINSIFCHTLCVDCFSSTNLRRMIHCSWIHSKGGYGHLKLTLMFQFVFLSWFDREYWFAKIYHGYSCRVWGIVEYPV